MMLQNVPQEQLKNLSRDERREIELERVQELINKKDEENTRLKDLLKKNYIEF